MTRIRYNHVMTKNRNKRAIDRPSSRIRLVWYFIFLVYLAIIIYILIDATGSLDKNPGTNLVFFEEIRRFWNLIRFDEQNRVLALQNLFGNIAIFIPFGFFFPLVTNRRLTGLKTAVAAIVSVSAIELYQLVSNSGIFDVDDFILNWSGVLIGWLLYKGMSGLRRLARRRES